MDREECDHALGSEAGWKKTIEVLPAILVCGGSFALTQFVTSNFLGPELPDITSAIVSMVSLTVLLKFWQPKSVFRFKNEKDWSGAVPGTGVTEQAAALSEKNNHYSLKQITRAWSPFILLVVIICLWGASTDIKNLLGKLTMIIPIPGLNLAIEKVQPIVSQVTPYQAVYKFDILAATGTAILFACVISKFLIGISWKMWIHTLGKTLKELTFPLIMVVSVLGFAYIENYSGMSSTLGLGLASTGAAFPFVSPIIGWIGVFLTGSDTSSNALFSNLQKVSAHQIGIDQTLLIAANSTGGVAAKMISPQSIAVATAATGQVGVHVHAKTQPAFGCDNWIDYFTSGLCLSVDDPISLEWIWGNLKRMGSRK